MNHKPNKYISLFLFLAGILLILIILAKFIPVLGSDSTGPQILSILWNFGIYEYLLIILAGLFFISGWLFLALGFSSKKMKT